MGAPLRIWLFGAPGTGPQCLARELAPALRQRGRDAAIGIAGAALEGAQFLPGDASDLCLLMGLDALPEGGDMAAAEDADRALRKRLQREGRLFRVVYGQGPERLVRALRAIDTLLADTPERHTRWRAACEKCSDPECEHRLFRSRLDAVAADAPY